MDTRLAELLDDLVTSCETVSLREEDWQKVYAVSLCAHAQGGVPDIQRMKWYLISKGCSKQKAGFLGRQFQNLCTVLRMYDEQKRQRSGL